MRLANNDYTRYNKHDKYVQTEYEKNIFTFTWMKIQGDEVENGIQR